MIAITKEQIREIFDNAKSQGDYILALYRHAHPDFDEIKSFGNYPTAHPDTNEFIMKQAILWDQLHRPNVLAGGGWMNSGFSTDDTVPPWFVVPATNVTRNSVAPCTT